MSESEYVPADELTGSVMPAEAPPDIQPPIGVLLALRPFGTKTVTVAGQPEFTAMECYTVAVGEDGSYTDLGLRDVSWQFVMRELDKASDEAPWVVGTVVKKGRAYFLTVPTPEDMKRAAVAVDALVTDRQTAEDEAQQAAEEPF